MQPFASLPTFVSENTPRVLINQERVGGLGSRADDVLVLGDCDAGVRKLADALGWREELEEMWVATKKADQPESGQEAVTATKDKHQQLEDEMDKLTKDIDQSLRISENHVRTTKEDLEKEKLDVNISPEKAKVNGEIEKAAPDSVVTATADKPTLPLPENLHEGNGSIDHVFGHINPRSPEKPSL